MTSYEVEEAMQDPLRKTDLGQWREILNEVQKSYPFLLTIAPKPGQEETGRVEGGMKSALNM